MNRWIRALPVILALAASGGCSAAGMGFWVQAGFWDPEFETKLSQGQNSPRLDLQSGLGVSKDPDNTIIVIDGGIIDPGSRNSGRPPGRYNFGFWTMRQRHTSDLGPIGVTFDNKTFSSNVSSRNKVTNYIFTGEAPGQAGKGQYGGAIFGVHLLNVEFEIDEVGGGDSAKLSKWAPMPVLGVRYEAQLGAGLTWYGLLEGMSLAIFDIDSFDAEFLHMDTGLKLRLSDNMFLMGGYKIWEFKVGLDDDYIQIDSNGATLVFRVDF